MLPPNLVTPSIERCFQHGRAYIIEILPFFSLRAIVRLRDPASSHDSTRDYGTRLGAHIQMSGQRILRRFPFALNLGTDICHVTRVRKILESPRASRFVQRILSDEERRHPKIQCILNKEHSPSSGRSAMSSVVAAGVKDHSPSTPAPDPDELQLAATFMAGRYGRPISNGQHLAWYCLYSWRDGLID